MYRHTKQLEKELTKRKMSKLQLSKETKLTYSDLVSCMKGNKNFFPKYRKAISEYLKLDENVLFYDDTKESKR